MCQLNFSFFHASGLKSERRNLLAPPRIQNQHILLFHSTVCNSITPSLPQPTAPSRQNYTPVSVKFRYASCVCFQNANTTRIKTTYLRKILFSLDNLRQTFTCIFTFEEDEYVFGGSSQHCSACCSEESSFIL